MERDSYRILGVRSDATEEEIRQAYHDLARVWHPDRFQSDPRLQQVAQERLREINAAYQAVKRINTGHSRRQASYDRGHSYQYAQTASGNARKEYRPRTSWPSPSIIASILARSAFFEFRSGGRVLSRVALAVACFALIMMAVRIGPLLRPPSLDLDLLAGRARLIRPQILTPTRILDPASDVKVAADLLVEWARGEVLDLWKPESWNGSRTPVAVARTMPVAVAARAEHGRPRAKGVKADIVLPNGTELIVSERQSGVGELRFINNTGLEEIAVLSRRKSPVRAIYIRPKSEALLKQIDTGIYEVHLELGSGADLKHLCFERDRYTPDPLGPFQFFSLTMATGTTGQHYEVVVNPPATARPSNTP